MQRSIKKTLVPTLAALLLAAASPAQTPAQTVHVATASSRTDLALTLYQQGFALVREGRKVGLPSGRSVLVWEILPWEIEPASVLLTAPQGGFTVLRRSVENRKPEPHALLQAWTGGPVVLHQPEEGLVRPGRLLSSGGGEPVLELEGRIAVGPPGWLSLPELPAGFTTEPKMRALVSTSRRIDRLDLSYLTQGMGWEAEHTLLVSEAGNRGSLRGWATVRNDTELAFEDATLELLAGDVRRGAAPVRQYRVAAAPMEMAEAEPSERAFSDYHLYTYEGRVDLPPQSSSQLQLVNADGLPVDRRYLVRGQAHLYRSMQRNGGTSPSVAVVLEVQTDSEAKPLPAGSIQVYRTEETGTRRFVGEGSIPATPAGESFQVEIGTAFDLVVERTQTGYEQLGRCTAASSWEVVLRNRKKEAATIEVREPVGGDWEILEASHDWKKLDASTYRFLVEVEGGGETTITWRVRTRWC